MFVDTPRIRNSASARRARATAVEKSRPRHVSLTSIESKWALISAPRLRAAVQPDARAAGRPVAGDAAGVGAEAVGRVLGGDPALQSRAVQPQRSWLSPRSSSVSPAAMRIWLATRSTSVISSVTVCSTWIRGFISMNT